jgi:hypothetical protein
MKAQPKKGTWSDVKAVVSTLNARQLVTLVADLYSLSKENRNFLHARYAVGPDPLEPYRETITSAMYPDIMTNKPIRVAVAKKAITDYTRAVGDPAGVAELMTLFVEEGNAFTVEFGDIDEPFYDALNGMYRRAVEQVKALPDEARNALQDRLKNIMTSAKGIGWGYHDMLYQDYYEAFPDDVSPSSAA